jgi:hypothetical protein
MLIAEPVYTNFKDRLKTKLIYLFYFLFFTVIFTVGIETIGSIEDIVIILIILLLFLIIIVGYPIYKTKFYVKRIMICPEIDKIEIEIYRFDKLYETKWFSFKNTKVRIDEDYWTRYKTYKLNFYSDQKKIYSIAEEIAWSTAIFIPILKYVLEVKGLPFYGNTIRVRGNLKKYFPNERNFSITD